MNIGFVGVGRMGANMARRLKDRGFHVTAIYDTNRAVATELASELGCAAAQDLSRQLTARPWNATESGFAGRTLISHAMSEAPDARALTSRSA